jgi:hypothetical protein
MGDFTLIQHIKARAGSGDETTFFRLKRRFFANLASVFRKKPARCAPGPVTSEISKQENSTSLDFNPEETSFGNWELPDETVVLVPKTPGVPDINTEDLSVNTQCNCSCGAKSFHKNGECVRCSGLVNI